MAPFTKSANKNFKLEHGPKKRLAFLRRPAWLTCRTPFFMISSSQGCRLSHAAPILMTRVSFFFYSHKKQRLPFGWRVLISTNRQISLMERQTEGMDADAVGSAGSDRRSV